MSFQVYNTQCGPEIQFRSIEPTKANETLKPLITEISCVLNAVIETMVDDGI